MAEQIPFNTIASILTKLGSLAFQEIRSIYAVPKELRKLEEKLETIKAVLLDAEEKQEKSHAVKAWVRRLKDVVYDADDLLDDFATHQLQRGVARKVSGFFSSSNQVVFRSKMSNKVKEITERVDNIAKEIPFLNLIQRHITHEGIDSWRETHSHVLASEIVGRDEDKGEIIKLLLSSDNQEKFSMVAIVGIGGLGKTTLAQLVFNDERVVQCFERRIWVCVSDNFDVKSLVKKILKEVCEEDVEGLELNGLKNLLHKKLNKKRCLLVLDDVWNQSFEKWDQLRILLMVVRKESKIVVTTRNYNVASIMGIDSPFVLKGLKETQSWHLFSKIALGEGQEKVHPRLVKIGKEIANMCNGVPLVVKTLGTILRSQTEESQWLSIRNNENLLSLGVGNDNVLSVLKLSYDNLPVHLKQCFAYFALFPKDHEIEKKLLVELWMAEGYILDENVGDQYFDELLSRSLLEEFDKDPYNDILSYKMHDLIHDLAQSVIGSEVLVLEDDVKEISKEVHHLSLSRPMNLKLKALKVKHIRTLLSIETEYGYENSISSTNVSSFKCLRVLSLNNFGLNEVSKSLGKLCHLRYLDLSYNNFEVLPNSITRLKNLQTLKLVGCDALKKFPQDIRELINLRHWENGGNLSHMPCGIGELTLLQSLSVFVVGNGGNGEGWFKDDHQIARLSELKGLNNLKGDLQIEMLENVKDVMVESREANLMGKRYVQSLGLKWSIPIDEYSGVAAEPLMEGLQPHPNLKRLRMEGYRGMRFPSWMMNGGLSDMLPNLTTINLKRCSRCHALPCFVRLPHLKFLELRDLYKVEYMEECSSEGPFFPSLEKLSLFRMPKLKELWRRRDLPPSFPCLSQLDIYLCDELASLELHSSPLLSSLKIYGCSKLTSLLLPPTPLLSHLDIEDCHNLASLELSSSPLLSSLKIWKCPKLTSLLVPPSPLLSQLDIQYCGYLASLELHSFPLLSSLKIYQCPKLTSLLVPPSPLLSQLDIEDCDDLASLELHSSPLLSSLKIDQCPKLTSLLVPPSPLLSQLDIRYCGDLASLELHSSPLLSSLKICRCPKLTSLLVPPSPLLSQLDIDSCGNLASLDLHSSPLLSCLKICHCPKLTSLLVPPSPLLSKLDIKSCDNLASLELHSSPLCSKLEIRECPKLTSLLLPPSPLLSKLDIMYCGNLASLELHSSPLLSSLYISYCPKLTSVQVSSLPCLKTLSLDKVREEVLRQLMLATTSSLKSLSIWSIYDMISLPDELLQHASTLQHLSIRNCCGLAELPHWIGSLTSLRKLFIRNCDHLTERCKRETGEDWPKIAHIPGFHITDCDEFTVTEWRLRRLAS